MTGAVSRRELFSNLLAPFTRGRSADGHVRTNSRAELTVRAPNVAVIQGRFCLAYQRSFCSTCSERCPVPNAIIVENGIPRVNASACTGCGVPRGLSSAAERSPDGRKEILKYEHEQHH
jgi:Na+-translocating ferredoxin:NAD+ oxidoreductase RNF subunit RnfB